MVQLITGKAGKLQEREAGSPGNTWVEKTLAVVDWGSTYYVKLSQDLEKDLPDEGDPVAIEVSVRTYVSKAEIEKASATGRAPKAGHELFGHRRNAEVEAALFGTTAGVRAVS